MIKIIVDKYRPWMLLPGRRVGRRLILPGVISSGWQRFFLLLWLLLLFSPSLPQIPSFTLTGALLAEAGPGSRTSVDRFDSGGAFFADLSSGASLIEKFELGSETGGDPSEARSMNRGISWTTGAIRSTYRATPDLLVDAHASARYFADYTHYNSRENHALDRLYLHTASLSLRYNHGAAGGFSKGGPAASLRAGRLTTRLTPYGVLYEGENRAAVLDFSYGWSGPAVLRRAGGALFAIETEREIHLSGRPHSDSHLAGGGVFAQGGRFYMGLWTAVYDSEGRRALAHPAGGVLLENLDPDNRTDMILMDRMKTECCPDTSALPDRRVQYYILQGSYRWSSVYLEAMGVHHFGQESIPDWKDRFSPVPPTTVQGSLLYMSTRFLLGDRRTTNDYPYLPGGSRQQQNPIAGKTFLDPTTGTMELSLLWTTRDRETEDGVHKGYGSIRPEVHIMGAESSILVSGPTVVPNASPFTNHSSGQALFYPVDEPTRAFEAPDNRDPAVPDYENGGLRMISLSYRHLFKGFAPSIRLNYGDLANGSGVEGILRLETGRKLNGMDVQVFLSATGLQYRPDSYRRDPWTGLIAKDSIRYYSRYILGATIQFQGD